MYFFCMYFFQILCDYFGFILGFDCLLSFTRRFFSRLLKFVLFLSQLSLQFLNFSMIRGWQTELVLKRLFIFRCELETLVYVFPQI